MFLTMKAIAKKTIFLGYKAIYSILLAIYLVSPTTSLHGR